MNDFRGELNRYFGEKGSTVPYFELIFPIFPNDRSSVGRPLGVEQVSVTAPVHLLISYSTNIKHPIQVSNRHLLLKFKSDGDICG